MRGPLPSSCTDGTVGGQGDGPAAAGTSMVFEVFSALSNLFPGVMLYDTAMVVIRKNGG